MKRKLLLLFFTVVSVQVFAQNAVAYKPLDILQCENTDFTLMGPVVSQILGDQNPQIFTVTFYDTYNDADTMSNTLPPFAFTQTGQPRTIYARVTSTVNGSYDITDFNLIAYGSGAAPNMNFTDITVCGSYTLPNYYGQYYNGAPIPQNIIPNAGVITQTTTITAFSMCNPSGSSNTFTVTVLPYSAPSTPPFTYFGFCYETPQPEYEGNFYTGPNGTGILVNSFQEMATNDNFTLHYVQDGGCYSSVPVEFEFFDFPVPDPQHACDLDGDMQFTVNLDEMRSSSFMPGIEQFAATYHLTEADAYANINPLPLNHTFTGTIPNEDFTGNVYARLTYDQCVYVSEMWMYIHVINSQEVFQVTGCDPNNDGLYHVDQFQLGTITNDLQVEWGETVTLHESLADANSGQNALAQEWEVLGYNNTSPSVQTLYARVNPVYCDVFIREIQVNVVTTDDCSTNILSGTVKSDTDGNGCGANDPGVPVMVIYTNTASGNTITSYTVNGAYIFYGLPDGPGTVQVVNAPPGVTIMPAIANIDFAAGTDMQTANFCANVPPVYTDVAVTVSPVSLARPGFEAKYAVVLANNSAVVQNGSVTFQFDPAIMIYVPYTNSSAVLSGNTITYNYSNLSPYYTQVIYFRFLLAQPPTLIGGENLTYTATITGTGTDTTPENNTYVLDQLVVNSYDPNDIAVNEGETIAPEQTDRFLHYTIRFENTGSASAVNIRVETELDPNLDISTFTPVAGSHPYSVQRNGNKVKFYFNDIELPHTEPDRHGYLTYKIKPLSSVGLGDSMSAFADIFFDFNPPITTNTVTTTVQIPAGVSDFAAENFLMYPNPASGMVKVVLKENNGKAVVTVTDMLGKTVHTSTLSTEAPDINIHNLQPGMYMVSVSNGNSKAVRKLIVK